MMNKKFIITTVLLLGLAVLAIFVTGPNMPNNNPKNHGSVRKIDQFQALLEEVDKNPKQYVEKLKKVDKSPLSFDGVRWQDKKDVYSTNPIRIRMVDSLLKEYNFTGMSRDRLISILGEPTETPYFKNWDVKYWLGFERGIGVDSEWLVFKFDQNGKVIEYAVVKD